jgi:hypothetical protein
MLLSCHKNEEQHKDLWLLDSGCNNHMTGNRELLSCIDSSISYDITLGDDSLVKVQGKGIVAILTKHDVKKDKQCLPRSRYETYSIKCRTTS